jgi:hypothetical protein
MLQWEMFSPTTQSFPCKHHSTNTHTHFHFNVLLSERQAGRDWTRSNKCFLGHQETLDRKVIWCCWNLPPWQSSNKNAKIQLKHINSSMSIFSILKAVLPVTVPRSVRSVSSCLQRTCVGRIRRHWLEKFRAILFLFCNTQAHLSYPLYNVTHRHQNTIP